MKPKIVVIPEKKLIGKSLKMSLANNKTGELWKSFMPRKKDVKNTIGTELYSLQVYDSLYFNNFNPHNEFEKWATMEVSDFSYIPDEMNTFILKEGLYAIFSYKGSSNDNKIFQDIFTSWLPNSKYIIDSRPHFEILGEKYKNGEPNSEEEICIPIKEKK